MYQYIKHKIIPVLAILLFAQPLVSDAAEISFVSNKYSQTQPISQLHIEGVIKKGDVKRLENLLQKNNICLSDCGEDDTFDGGSIALATLNSPGGNYSEGIRLAAFFRENYIATRVENEASCLSACAIAFLGGSAFWPTGGVGTYINRILEPGGKVGFHSPLIPDKRLQAISDFSEFKSALDVTRLSIAAMIKLLNKYYVDAYVIDKIIASDANEYWTIDTAEDLYLANVFLPDFPAKNLNIGFAGKVRNACSYLLAKHYNIVPSQASDYMIPEFSRSSFGETKHGHLKGYEIDDRPLNVAYCGSDIRKADNTEEFSASLYKMANAGEDLDVIISFHNRTDGAWSSGAYNAGTATKNTVYLGALNNWLLPPDFKIESLASSYSKPANKHNTTPPHGDLLNLPRDFQLIESTPSHQIFRKGRVTVKVGLYRDFNKVKFDRQLNRLQLRSKYFKNYNDAFVRSAEIGQTGAVFYHFGILADSRTLLVKLNIGSSTNAPISRAEKSLITKIACGTLYSGNGLPCAR